MEVGATIHGGRDMSEPMETTEVHVSMVNAHQWARAMLQVVRFVRENNERNTIGQQYVLGQLFSMTESDPIEMDDRIARVVKRYNRIAGENVRDGFNPHLWISMGPTGPVGVLGCSVGPEYYTHLFFVVHVDHRRNGICKRLIKTMEEWISENTTIRYHHVTTSVDNIILKEVLICLDYQIVGTIRGKRREMITLVKPTGSLDTLL